MILERRSGARGHTGDNGLDSRHAFSSGGYYDPQWMGFGALRVLNDITLAPGAALPAQRHANMELLNFVVSGVLAYAGDAGSGEVHAGELQWIGAGHGMEHRAANGSDSEPVHFLQAWIQPDRLNASPAIDQRACDTAQRRGRWATLVSPDGDDGSLALRQHAWVRGVLLGAGDEAGFALDPARRYWLHVVRGEIGSAGLRLRAGDALGIAGEGAMAKLAGVGDGIADVLLFDLPG